MKLQLYSSKTKHKATIFILVHSNWWKVSQNILFLLCIIHLCSIIQLSPATGAQREATSWLSIRVCPTSCSWSYEEMRSFSQSCLNSKFYDWTDTLTAAVMSRTRTAGKERERQAIYLLSICIAPSFPSLSRLLSSLTRESCIHREGLWLQWLKRPTALSRPESKSRSISIQLIAFLSPFTLFQCLPPLNSRMKVRSARERSCEQNTG